MVYYADCLVPMIIICRIACHADARCRISTYRFSILSLEMPNALECRYACRRCRIASRHFIHSVLVPTYVGIAWSTAARDPKIRSSGNLFSWCLSSVFSELFDKWPRRGIWFLSQENREWRRQYPRILVLPKCRHHSPWRAAVLVGAGCIGDLSSFPPLRFPYAANT